MATQKAKASTKPAAQAKHGHEDPEERVGNAIGRTEQFIYKNGKTLITILLVIVLLIGGYFAYTHLYQAGRADKASAAMFVAQQNLAQEMYEVALNGDGNQLGFLDVIAQYGPTPQGNLARHYAGECYVKLGDYDSALDYLTRYKEVKGVPAALVNAQNLGLRGDIYVQKGDLPKAIEMYSKAVKAGEDPLTSPYYLKKLGLACISANKAAEANEAFQRVLDEYPQSMEARDIEKYMGVAGQMQ